MSLWSWDSRWPASAKLNLFLHVVGRRADGYHLLQTVFRFIDRADFLGFSPRADGEIVLQTPIEGVAPESDLTVRAARLLKAATGCREGASIRLEKNLPMGGGLGGGSSDAATVLLALNHLWQTGLTRPELEKLGLQLGADVPVFVHGRNTFAEGVGEILTPLDWPSEAFAVVKPAAALPTAKIFSSELLTRDTNAATVADFADTQSRQRKEAGNKPVPLWGRNDLQPAAEAICPDVTAAIDWLERRFGPGRMTGSGSAVFARTGMGAPPLATCSDGTDPFSDLPVGWVGRMCRSLTRHPLDGWAD